MAGQYNQINAWDIEHVSPRTVEKDIEKACTCFEEFRSNIQSLIDNLGEDTRAAVLKAYLAQKDFFTDGSNNILKDASGKSIASPEKLVKELGL